MSEGIVWYLPFEESFIVWLQQLGAGTALQTILFYLNNFFSFLGEEFVCIAVMGFLFWGISKEKGERLGVAVLLANVSIGMLKNIFARIRPWAASDRIELLREVDGYSFPSGHSANCTALYPTLSCEYRRTRALTWIAIFVPLLCGVSRCYVGAHWPTDVLVGLGMGLAVFGLTELVLHKIKNKYVFYLILIALSAVGLFYCTTNDYYNSFGMLIGFTAGRYFEEKLVRFENTDNLWLALLRTLVGGALYFALNAAFKLMLGPLFPEGTQGYLLMRTLRYALVAFVLIGVYPCCFFLEKKLLRAFRQEKKSES
ncbi:MAG: phosphatase PAP2 family protein [Oscillospiraceae bacterium]|nr:phosphatase PAP2 family protein [Oscillospiraceae bacterium]